MAKFCGAIGFTTMTEVRPGYFKECNTERTYRGDVEKASYRQQTSEKVNADVTISNVFSVVADAFATENFSHMRYIKFKGIAWSITSVEVQYPRLLISAGGVYDGDTPTIPSEAD